MTKLETWNAAQAIINDLGLSKDKTTKSLAAFEALLAPKKAGGNRPEPIDQDGTLFYFCRFTGLYFPSSEMVYQNDETRVALKDKGYSNIGISLWNKGQKYLKDLKMKSVEIAYGDDQSDEMREQGMALHKEAKELEAANSMNNHAYLVEHFLTDEQADSIDGQDLPSL